jgi:hypothetical protein
MEYSRERILEIINNILLAPRLSLEIAKLLLEFVFVGWNKPENVVTENQIRKFLITDLYVLLCNNNAVYIEELKDYSKNAEEHLLIQNKIKKTNDLMLHLQKKDFHDEIIYLMNIFG